MSDFDFGFTAVDEDELDAVQKVQKSAEANSVAVEKLEDKVNKIYNAVLPLLTNLKKNPEKDYIYWPNRNLKIDQFEVVLQKIINE
jgi:hypothetical protein|tara:strand:+ start:171 stop:428 length:258 start_codon:yes stop_codon:yes gene_type:complete